MLSEISSLWSGNMIKLASQTKVKAPDSGFQETKEPEQEYRLRSSSGQSKWLRPEKQLGK